MSTLWTSPSMRSRWFVRNRCSAVWAKSLCTFVTFRISYESTTLGNSVCLEFNHFMVSSYCPIWSMNYGSHCDVTDSHHGKSQELCQINNWYDVIDTVWFNEQINVKCRQTSSISQIRVQLRIWSTIDIYPVSNYLFSLILCIRVV